jgi:hypothetical protein
MFETIAISMGKFALWTVYWTFVLPICLFGACVIVALIITAFCYLLYPAYWIMILIDKIKNKRRER